MERIRTLRKRIIPTLKKYGVIKAGIFGSFARGDHNKKSDVDVLIKFKGKKSLFDLAGLEIELEKILKRKVDVGEYSVIHPMLKERILKEEIRIYEKRS